MAVSFEVIKREIEEIISHSSCGALDTEYLKDLIEYVATFCSELNAKKKIKILQEQFGL